jgi:hypothetical protein
MHSFIEWAAENKLELPAVSEGATRRAGIAHWAYPDGYIRSHYPDGYFMPTAADALFKMAIGKHKVSHMTPPDQAIGPDGSVRGEKGRSYDTE